jgi:hypothetical protein
MTFVYIVLLLIVLTQYLIERRLRFQSERLDLQAERRGELEKLFRREVESLSGSLHRIDRQLQKDTNQFAAAVTVGFRGCDVNFNNHEERLDTNTKRLNDAWSHLLRLEGRVEAAPHHFEAAEYTFNDRIADLSARVAALEQSLPLRLKKARLARV